MRKFVILALFSCALLSSVFAEETLSYSIVMIRHGDRKPVNDFLGSENSWYRGTLGDLLEKGQDQLFEVGRGFRGRLDWLGFEHDNETNVFSVMTTNKNRTIDSAYFFMRGFESSEETAKEDLAKAKKERRAQGYKYMLENANVKTSKLSEDLYMRAILPEVCPFRRDAVEREHQRIMENKTFMALARDAFL